MRMVFRKPAKSWFDSLPAGNGKTAIAVCGGIRRETVFFNDAELWSGYPSDNDSPTAREALSEVRRLVFEGKARKAHALAEKKLGGDYAHAFMPLAELTLRFKAAKGKGYLRCVSLDEGTVRMDDGATERTAFVSRPHAVAVYSVRAKQGRFSVRLSGRSALRSRTFCEDDVLYVCGNAPDYAAPNYLVTRVFPVRYNEGKAAAFCLAVKVDTDGEIVVSRGRLAVEGATYAHFYAVTETGFRGYDRMPESSIDKVKAAAEKALSSLPVSYRAVLAAHTEDYRGLWSRQSLRLAEGDGDVARLLAAARGGKPSAELIGLLYGFGKYLTICGSRSSQPLNLQGQWNRSVRPPWSSNLTTNINAQMNYWGTSRAGLEPCLAPFYDAVKEIAERGRRTAEVNFGARGFACNHNVDIWRNTSPVKGNPRYMFSPFCGAWLANEMFAHKKNGGISDADADAVIAQAAEFCLDNLVEYSGGLVICPSSSPETQYKTAGGTSALGIASAFEMSVVRQTLAYCLQSGADGGLKKRAAAALERLRPYECAENGLAEWAEGKVSSEKGHRHFSPLYGVYPGNVVKRGSKEFEWAHRLFRYRLDNSDTAIGWNAAWAMCLAGRFRDEQAARDAALSFMSRSLLDNLFAYHPPRYFQIDGNMGFVAGVNETLLTVDDGTITLLPACFEEISEGCMKGAVVNGARLDFEWKNGEVTFVSSDKPVKISAAHIRPDAVKINVETICDRSAHSE